MSNENLDYYKVSENSDKKEFKNIKAYSSSFKKAQQIGQEIQNLKKLHNIYAAILNYFYTNYSDEIVFEVYKGYKYNENNLFTFLILVYPLDKNNVSFIKNFLNFEIEKIDSLSDYIRYVKNHLTLKDSNLFVDFIYNIIIYYNVGGIKTLIDKKNKIERESLLKELYLNIKKELGLN